MQDMIVLQYYTRANSKLKKTAAEAVHTASLGIATISQVAL